MPYQMRKEQKCRNCSLLATRYANCVLLYSPAFSTENPGRWRIRRFPKTSVASLADSTTRGALPHHTPDPPETSLLSRPDRTNHPLSESSWRFICRYVKRRPRCLLFHDCSG